MGSDRRASTRTWRRTTAAGACLLFVTWATTARAAPFELTWSAPEGCPSREQMVAATRARLGESEPSSPPELFVRGIVVAEEGGFVITFLVKDAAGADVGEREMRVQGRSCELITDPAALVLATMISVVRPRPEPAAEPPPSKPDDAAHAPDASVEPPVGITMPPASTARAPVPATLSDMPDMPSREATMPARHGLAAASVVSIGVLPSVGFGAALRTAHLVRSRFLVGFETSFEVGGSVRAGRGDVGFQLLSASMVAGIQVLRSAKVELISVISFRGGVLRTTPSGFQLVKAEARPMALAGIGAVLRVPLGSRLYAEALPQAEMSLVRDIFQASEARTTYFLHQPSPVAARVSVGVGYEFP